MVFARAVITAIKKKLTSLFFVSAIILAATAFNFNAVFARTGMDISVEVNWTDQSVSTRPASVTLRLKRDSCSGTETANITLTSADVDPSDNNKWVGVFVNVPRYVNYYVCQDNVTGYNTETDHAVDYYLEPELIGQVHTGTVSYSTQTLGEYNFILIRNNNNYYLWTYEFINSSTSRNQIIALLRQALGNNNISIGSNKDNYSYGLPTSTTLSNTTISGSETNVTFRGSNITGFWYGNIARSRADLVSLANTLNATTYNVSYSFTGAVQPPNASSLLPSTASYTPGATVTVAQEPTATGYRFLGWTMNGSSISGTFTMPSNDVTISGSWEQFNGYFAPSISKQITNPQNVYRYGDTVEFLVVVSNPESYPITNVEVTENLVGTRFLPASGYTVSGTGDVATIATIPANGIVVLYAEYDIAQDVTQTLTNTAEITAASASNFYYLDTSQSYIASAQFATQSWQDVPVLTGVNTNSTILYSILMLFGAIGIGGGSIVTYKQKIKEREK